MDEYTKPDESYDQIKHDPIPLYADDAQAGFETFFTEPAQPEQFESTELTESLKPPELFETEPTEPPCSQDQHDHPPLQSNNPAAWVLIKPAHIAISSGGIYLLKMYAVIRQCIESGQLDTSGVQSICGTSAGAIIGACIALYKIPDIIINWDWIDDYLLNRDYTQLFKLNWNMSTLWAAVMSLYTMRGVYDRTTLLNLVGPIFFHHGIRMDTITLAQYRDKTGILLTCMATRYRDLEPVELSADTFPDMTLLDALYASACVPFVCQPLQWLNELYVDGGISVIYPLEYCKRKYPGDAVFGIYVHQTQKLEPLPLPPSETASLLNKDKVEVEVDGDAIPSTPPPPIQVKSEPRPVLPSLTQYAMHLIRSFSKRQLMVQPINTPDQFVIQFPPDEAGELELLQSRDARVQIMKQGRDEWVEYIRREA